MRSLGTRRAVQVAGAATVAVIALAGCSAGQVAETAILKAPVAGLNTQSPDGTLLIRNLQVAYNSPEGYPSGGTAPLEVSLFNETQSPMTVSITSGNAGDGSVTAQQIGVTGAQSSGAPSSAAPSSATPSSSSAAPSSAAPSSAAPSSAAATPSTAPSAPAQFTIAPKSSLVFLPGDARSLQAVGLDGALAPGGSLALVFKVSGSGQQIEVTAPFEIPTSPAPRGEGIENENSEE